MHIVQLTNDNREIQKRYHLDEPVFGPAPEALLEGFKAFGKEVEVHVISCLQQMPRRSPAKLADNIFYHPLHVPRIGWLRTGYQGCIRATRRKIKEIKPDIVHGQGTERECAMCAISSGYPNVLTLHGVMNAVCRATRSRAFTYYWYAKHLEWFALRHTQGVVAISTYVEALVSRLNRKTWLIPNALRSQFFKPLLPTPRRLGPPRLINVGMICSYKRQLELLEKLVMLREDLPFTMAFVGKANYGDTYARKFLNLLHTTNARYGGFVHHESWSVDQLVEAYDDSDAMLHVSSEESFGLIFGEALARNLPLFASDVGAVRQIANGVANCCVFQPSDLAGLLSSLRHWINTNSYLATRDYAPNRVIEARNQPRVVAAQHMGVYREVLAARRISV
jgi:glycosyltransferase involved in cell wall biosynthesis